MENRFGLKDFIMLALLAGILVVQLLAMWANDRHWDRLLRVETAIDQQTGDLTALKRTLGDFDATLRRFDEKIKQGVALNPGTTPGTTPGTNPGTTPGTTPNGDARTATSQGPDPQGDIFRRVREVQRLPDYALGDTLVDVFNSAPPKLNYFTSHDIYARVVYSRIIEPLAGWDIGEAKMVPYLAESWKMSDDGLSLDVMLRKDVTFSDGVSMTADDVVYTWKISKNPEITDGHTREYLRHIDRVEKIDDHHVRFYFQMVFYENFIRAMEEPVLPKHFFEKFTDRDIRDGKAMLLGTGPYMLRDPLAYEPGQQIEIVRNGRYWGPPGPWDRIVWRIIEKESSEQLAFLNGETDLFAPTPEQHVEMDKDAKIKGRTKQFVYEHVRTGYIYIGWNQKRGDQPTVFADKRVRQAMTMLLDRERIVKEIFLGFASVANGPFHHMGPQYNPDVKTWPYDPERAIALLKEAGFTRDAQGVMHRPDGEPFAVKLTYPAGSDLYQKVMLFAKDNYARAGIHIELDPLEWTLLLKNLQERTFDAITLGWGAGGLESDIEQMFHTRTIAEGDNRNAYSNPQLDKLIDEAHVTLDTDKRMALWKQCHEILHEDQPYTFLFRSQVRLWMDKRIQNVQRIPVFGINYVSTWPVPLEWYVPKADQGKRGGGAATP